MRLIVRLAAATSLAFVLAACGSTTTTPTPTPAAPSHSVAPAPTGPTLPTGNVTVSGVVTEAGHPLAGVNVNAWVDTGSIGYSYMYAHGATLTDAGGGYRLPSLPAGAGFWLQVYKDGYVQQCAQSRLQLTADATINAQLVSKANLSGLPAPSAAGARTVSGVVVEMTSDGKRPVANVFVDFEPLEDFPAATTYTDADGRFSLCGLPQSDAVSLGAGINNRVAYVSVPSGQSTVEISLP